MKQWLFIASLVVLAAGSVAITVVTLHESSRKALLSHNPKPSASEFLADVVPDKTVDQLRTLAETGQADAQAVLGYRFLTGNGVIKDYDEAVKWFRKAADQGNGVAQCDLGFCYANGFGVPKDYCDGCVQAYMWYNLAAAQGQPESANNLALLEKKMTPGQIAEAQRLSREFRAVGLATVKTNGPYRYKVEIPDAGTFQVDSPTALTDLQAYAAAQREAANQKQQPEVKTNGPYHYEIETNGPHRYTVKIEIEGHQPLTVEMDRSPTPDDIDFIIKQQRPIRVKALP
jgi:hypothetical protein